MVTPTRVFLTRQVLSSSPSERPVPASSLRQALERVPGKTSENKKSHFILRCSNRLFSLHILPPSCSCVPTPLSTSSLIVSLVRPRRLTAGPVSLSDECHALHVESCDRQGTPTRRGRYRRLPTPDSTISRLGVVSTPKRTVYITFFSSHPFTTSNDSYSTFDSFLPSVL